MHAARQHLLRSVTLACTVALCVPAAGAGIEATVLRDLADIPCSADADTTGVPYPWWHWLHGRPVQCLRMTVALTSRTQVVRVPVELGTAVSGRTAGVELFGAWCLASTQTAAQVSTRLIADGTVVLTSRVTTALQPWRVPLPALTALEWEVVCSGPPGAVDVDWLLPAVLALRPETNNSPVLLWFSDGDGDAPPWSFDTAPGQAMRPVGFVPQLRVTGVSAADFPACAGRPVSLRACVANEGWRSSTVTRVTLALPGPEGGARILTNEVPALSPRGRAYVEWTITPNILVSTLDGTVTLDATGDKYPFSVPLVRPVTLPPPRRSETGWEKRVGPISRAIVYDWTEAGVWLRFTMDSAGVRAVDIYATNTVEPALLATLGPVCSVSIACSTTNTQELVLRPTSVQYSPGAPREFGTVLLRGVALDEAGTTWRFSQTFTLPEDDELRITTRLEPRAFSRLEVVQAPIVRVPSGTNDVLLCPGQAFRAADAMLRPARPSKWFFLSCERSLFPAADQAEPLVALRTANGATILRTTASTVIEDLPYAMYWRATTPNTIDGQRNHRIEAVALPDHGARTFSVDTRTPFEMTVRVRCDPGATDIVRDTPTLQDVYSVPRVTMRSEGLRVQQLLDRFYTNAAARAQADLGPPGSKSGLIEEAVLLSLEQATIQHSPQRKSSLFARLEQCMAVLRQAAPRPWSAAGYVNVSFYGSALRLMEDPEDAVTTAAADLADFVCALTNTAPASLWPFLQTGTPVAQARFMLLAGALCADYAAIGAATAMITHCQGELPCLERDARYRRREAPGLVQWVDLLEADVLAFRLTGEERYRDDARRCARAALAYVPYRHTAGEQQPGVPLGSLAAPTPWDPTALMPAPYAAAALADALYELAAVSPAENWHVHARLVRQALEAAYTTHAADGALPEGWDPLRGRALGRHYTPDALWALQLRDEQLYARLHPVALALREPDPTYCFSLAETTALTPGGDSVAVRVRWKAGQPVRMLLSDCPDCVTNVTLDGSALTGVGATSAPPVWHYRAPLSVLTVVFTPSNDVSVVTFELAPTNGLAAGASR